MAIDNAGHDELAGCVHHLGISGHVHLLADFGDLAVADQNRSGIYGPSGDGEDGSALYDDGWRGQHRGGERASYKYWFHWWVPLGPSAVGPVGVSGRAPGGSCSSTGSNLMPSTK